MKHTRVPAFMSSQIVESGEKTHPCFDNLPPPEKTRRSVSNLSTTPIYGGDLISCPRSSDSIPEFIEGPNLDLKGRGQHLDVVFDHLGSKKTWGIMLPRRKKPGQMLENVDSEEDDYRGHVLVSNGRPGIEETDVIFTQEAANSGKMTRKMSKRKVLLECALASLPRKARGGRGMEELTCLNDGSDDDNTGGITDSTSHNGTSNMKHLNPSANAGQGEISVRTNRDGFSKIDGQLTGIDDQKLCAPSKKNNTGTRTSGFNPFFRISPRGRPHNSLFSESGEDLGSHQEPMQGDDGFSYESQITPHSQHPEGEGEPDHVYPSPSSANFWVDVDKESSTSGFYSASRSSHDSGLLCDLDGDSNSSGKATRPNNRGSFFKIRKSSGKPLDYIATSTPNGMYSPNDDFNDNNDDPSLCPKNKASVPISSNSGSRRISKSLGSCLSKLRRNNTGKAGGSLGAYASTSSKQSHVAGVFDTPYSDEEVDSDTWNSNGSRGEHEHHSATSNAIVEDKAHPPMYGYNSNHYEDEKKTAWPRASKSSDVGNLTLEMEEKLHFPNNNNQDFNRQNVQSNLSSSEDKATWQPEFPPYANDPPKSTINEDKATWQPEFPQHVNDLPTNTINEDKATWQPEFPQYVNDLPKNTINQPNSYQDEGLSHDSNLDRYDVHDNSNFNTDSGTSKKGAFLKAKAFLTAKVPKKYSIESTKDGGSEDMACLDPTSGNLPVY